MHFYIYNKHVWVVPLKDKKRVMVANSFQNIIDKSKHKSSKTWVDQDSKFYKKFVKSWLKDNDIEMYSTYNEGKPVVTWRFIKTLKSKIYRHMTSVSKDVYVDKLECIIDKYNNAS